MAEVYLYLPEYRLYQSRSGALPYAEWIAKFNKIQQLNGWVDDDAPRYAHERLAGLEYELKYRDSPSLSKDE